MEKSWNCVFEFLWEPCLYYLFNYSTPRASTGRGCGWFKSNHNLSRTGWRSEILAFQAETAARKCETDSLFRQDSPA